MTSLDDLNEDAHPTPTPHDVPGRQRASQQALAWAEACDVQAARMFAYDDPDAHVLAGELLAVASRVRRWQEVPPTEGERQDTTQLFQFLLTRAFAYP